jgi:DNA-binding response OmpR family regulator
MILSQNQALLPPATASRIKVCVVDTDFGDYRPLLAERKLRGVAWEMISSGREALHQLQHDIVTLWVINMQLPDISGAELCQMIKSQSPWAVVWLLTDDYRPEDERAAWLAGAALFRPKPIDPAWFERITQRHALAKAV